MFRLFRIIRRLGAWRFRLGIDQALALQLRGEVRRDGLKLRSLSTRLEVEWYAREIHPWDRDDPPEKSSARFVRDSLADTEAAIGRLFDILPEVDIIRVTVREPASNSVIMAGDVCRCAPEPDARLSVGMRLWKRGIRYHSDGLCFEPLGSPDATVVDAL